MTSVMAIWSAAGGVPSSWGPMSVAPPMGRGLPAKSLSAPRDVLPASTAGESKSRVKSPSVGLLSRGSRFLLCAPRTASRW